jgi:hypothetical protein
MILENTLIKLKDCVKMEEVLKENETYEIIKYEVKLHGKKKKYILNIKD